jgi:hypothetical protein
MGCDHTPQSSVLPASASNDFAALSREWCYGTQTAHPDFKSNSEKYAVVRSVVAVMGNACEHSGRARIPKAAFGSSQDFCLLPYSRLTGQGRAGR